MTRREKLRRDWEYEKLANDGLGWTLWYAFWALFWFGSWVAFIAYLIVRFHLL